MTKKKTRRDRLKKLWDIVVKVTTPIIALGWLVSIMDKFWPGNNLYPVLALIFLAIIIWLLWLEIRVRRLENGN